jgi:hypothetical protein
VVHGAGASYLLSQLVFFLIEIGMLLVCHLIGS